MWYVCGREKEALEESLRTVHVPEAYERGVWVSTVITFVRSIVSYVVSFTEMFRSEWSPAQRVLHEDELVVSPIQLEKFAWFLLLLLLLSSSSCLPRWLYSPWTSTQYIVTSQT